MIKHNSEGSGDGAHLKLDAPALKLDFSIEKTYPNGDTLPGIWITDPVTDEHGKYLGRICSMLYPEEKFEDVEGGDGLYFGARYLKEAMGYTDPADHDKRIDCFRACEILYRHAAGLGNMFAIMNLGYVYSYDRCEGQYWMGREAYEKGEVGSYPREERAFECYSLAAEAGIPEACYKFGDMYKFGMGCEPDAAKAFSWYVRASEPSDYEPPVIQGSIALRLGTCYEEGFGCEHDFAEALEWYKRAVMGLDAAVAAGETWYAKPLARARAGLKRCEQEV